MGLWTSLRTPTFRDRVEEKEAREEVTKEPPAKSKGNRREIGGGRITGRQERKSGAGERDGVEAVKGTFPTDGKGGEVVMMVVSSTGSGTSRRDWLHSCRTGWAQISL